MKIVILMIKLIRGNKIINQFDVVNKSMFVNLIYISHIKKYKYIYVDD